MQLILKGGTTVIIPKLDTDIKKICVCIQNYKISYAHVIPQTILKFAANPIVKNYIPSLIKFFGGAASLSKELIELEEILLNHPAVADVAVIGHYSEQNLTKHSAVYIGGGVYFINQIPKTPSGKILRRILRKKIEKGPEVKKVILDHKNISSGTSTSETERLPALFEKKKDAIDLKLDPQEVYVYEIGPDFNQDHLVALKTCWVAEHPNRTEVFFITDNVKELNKYMEYLVSSVGLEKILITHPTVANAEVIEQNLTERPTAYIVREILRIFTEITEKGLEYIMIEIFYDYLTIGERLGRGAFGTVYQANSRSLGDVAMKEIDSKMDEKSQKGFRNE
ncbi:15312_t:CDS:2, partial [Racocetra fulgida]